MAVAAKTTGKEERARSVAAKIHEPDLERYYRFKWPPIVPGQFDFELALLRPRLPAFPLRTVETLNWVDEQSVLTGSVMLHRPVSDDPTSLPIRRGHQIRCRIRWGGHRYQLWTMRCEAPQDQVDQNTVTVGLVDDLVLLKRGKHDWIYRKDKAHPKGWTAEEITRDIGRRLGLQVGQIASSSTRITVVKRSTTAFAALSDAWHQERNAVFRNFVIRLRNRRLEVVTIQCNPLIYVLSNEIQSAAIQQQKGAGGSQPPTVLEGTAKVGKGKDAKKIRHTEHDGRVVRKFGYVHEKRDYGTVESYHDLVKQVRRDYAKALRVADTISVTHQGIPFIARGDGAQLLLPAWGYKGEDSFVFCSRANHTVQGAVYTSDFDFVFRDPYLANAKKEAAAKARGSWNASPAGSSSSPAVGSGPRWLVPASAEDDPPGTTASCGPLPADGRGYSVLSVSGTSSDTGTAGQALSAGSVWPCGVDLVMTNPANNASVTVHHVDNGAGSDSILPVVGIYPQTRADLGLDGSGSYHVIIQRADGGALSPVRGSRA